MSSTLVHLTTNSLLMSSTGDRNLTNQTTQPTMPALTEEPESILTPERIVNIVLVVVSSVTVILDLIFLILIITRTKKKTNQSFFIMNILVGDLLIGFSAIVIGGTWLVRPYNLGAANPDKILDRRLQCAETIMEKFWTVGTYANLFGLTLMTIDYLIAVFWSLKHATVLTKRWIFISISIGWILAFPIGFLLSMLKSQTYHKQMDNWTTKGTTYFCYQSLLYTFPNLKNPRFELNQHEHFRGVLIADFLVIAIVFMFIVGVYSAIVIVIVKAEKARRRLTYSNSSAAVPGLSKKIRRGVVTSACFVAGFAIVWFPLLAYYIITVFYKDAQQADYAPRLFLLITTCTGLVDVSIYAIRNKDIVKAIFTGSRRRPRSTGLQSNTRHTMKTNSTMA